MSPTYRTHLPGGDMASFLLTPEQRDVMRLVARGYTNPEIADELRISLAAVRDRIGRVLIRLNMRNATQAAVALARAGLL